MIVVFLGPPGSGKGTQAKKISAQKRWPHLSTGDMLRNAIAQGSKVGMEAKAFMDSGALVPDDVVIRLIEERSNRPDCHSGFILDGFPRNISQAEALDRMLKVQNRKVDKAVLFEISDGELVKRLSGRRTCVKCGAMYHVESAPSKTTGKCDQCGENLIQRDDDRTEVIQKRLDVYHSQTQPLIGFYEGQGKLQNVDARQDPLAVASALLKNIQ